MKYSDLSPELREKANACNTPEQIIALAKEEGFDLSDGELEAVAGGSAWRASEDDAHVSEPEHPKRKRIVTWRD